MLCSLSIAKYDLRREAKVELARLVRGKERKELKQPELQRRLFDLDSITLEPKCTLIMRSYTEHKGHDDEWLSEPFYSHPQGYKMCLSVYANGNGESKGSYVSVFVQLMWVEYDSSLSWPYKGCVTMELQDPVSGEAGKEVTINFNEAPEECAGRVLNGEMNTGWGIPQFIAHGDLMGNRWYGSNTYLQNDCLHFRVTSITV